MREKHQHRQSINSVYSGMVNDLRDENLSDNSDKDQHKSYPLYQTNDHSNVYYETTSRRSESQAPERDNLAWAQGSQIENGRDSEKRWGTETSNNIQNLPHWGAGE